MTCVVCAQRQAERTLCEACQKSYDTTLGGTIEDVIVWAAKRARYFARCRKEET